MHNASPKTAISEYHTGNAEVFCHRSEETVRVVITVTFV